jgi:hypothetical protein
MVERLTSKARLGPGGMEAGFAVAVCNAKFLAHEELHDEKLAEKIKPRAPLG